MASGQLEQSLRRDLAVAGMLLDDPLVELDGLGKIALLPLEDQRFLVVSWPALLVRVTKYSVFRISGLRGLDHQNIAESSLLLGGPKMRFLQFLKGFNEAQDV